MDIIKRAAQELKERVNKTSTIEKLLEEATSKENWQAHPKTLSTISDYTTSSEEWDIISKYIWERLYKSDKSSVRTFKTLVLVEYLLKNGSPKCIMEFKDELYKIRKLQDYQYVEGGEDKGHNVRTRAKAVVELLTDKDKLDHERQQAKELKSKMSQVGGSHTGSYSGNGSSGTSSNQINASKYSGFSSDSYKDPKFQAYSSKDLPASHNYKAGDSYDATEFKGLDKYRKKDEETVVEKKPATATTLTSVPEAIAPKPLPPKTTIGAIKIQPPSATGVTQISKPQSQPVQQQQAPQQQAKGFDLFEDDAPTAPVSTAKPAQDNDDDWGWTSAPAVKQPQPVVQQVQQPLYQQQPPQQLYQQQQHPVQQPLYQQPQQQFYPQSQQQQQPVQFQYNAPQPTYQQAPQQKQQQQQQNDLDFFSDFQSSTPQQTTSVQQQAKNYSKDEFDLINLGDMKKEAEKKQKEKESKNQANNHSDLGFSTLTTQLDAFSFNTPSFQTTAPVQQSNYSALNSIGTQQPTSWGHQPQQPMGYGYQNPQGYNNNAWPAQNQGYGMNPQAMYPNYGMGGQNQYPNTTNFGM